MSCLLILEIHHRVGGDVPFGLVGRDVLAIIVHLSFADRNARFKLPGVVGGRGLFGDVAIANIMVGIAQLVAQLRNYWLDHAR